MEHVRETQLFSSLAAKSVHCPRHTINKADSKSYSFGHLLINFVSVVFACGNQEILFVYRTLGDE